MYAKVFEQIFESSISEDYTLRHVFMDLLVLADRDGVVDMTIPAISRRTNIPIEIIQGCIHRLSQPDEHSRSGDEQGRRLVKLDDHRNWGWRIVNYVTYRDMRDDEARRAYFRQHKKKQRDAAKACTVPVVNVQDIIGHSTDVTNVTPQTQTQTHTQTQTQAENKESNGPNEVVDNRGQPWTTVDSSDNEMDEFSIWAEAAYDRHPKKKARVLALYALQKRFARDLPARGVFDRNHAVWCATEHWREKQGAFCPSLADWVEDDGWKKPPPEPRGTPSWER